MASASRATARMSSADGLAAIRYCGSSRANAFFAGSSEGNGLSVMAMMVWGMGALLTIPSFERGGRPQSDGGREGSLNAGTPTGSLALAILPLLGGGIFTMQTLAD